MEAHELVAALIFGASLLHDPHFPKQDGEVSCPNGRKTMIREKSFYPLSNAFPPQPGLERQNWCIEIVF